MIGVRTDAGPDGQLTYWTRFGDLAAMVATVFGGSIVLELLRQWWGPVGTIRVVPPACKARLARRTPGRTGAAGATSGAGPVLQRALHSRPRHPRAHLRDARMGAERGGRPRRAARSRLCRVLRGRRLFLRAAGDHFGLSFWVCLPLAGILAAFWGVLLGFPCCGCAAIISPSSRRLRRDHPPRHHQLAEPDRRAERRHRHSRPTLFGIPPTWR